MPTRSIAETTSLSNRPSSALSVVTDPPFRLTFNQEPEYLHAMVRSETIDHAMATSYLHEIAEKCSELGCTRLLIERDIPVMSSLADLFFITDEFVRAIQGVRVAFVNPYELLDDRIDFIVLTANNRGGNFSSHRTVQAAKESLLDTDAG